MESDQVEKHAIHVVKSSDAWSRFWQTGTLHSCVSGDEAAFSEEFWRRFFENADGAAKVLDIGTGNGLIPLLAMRHLRCRSIVYGIDAAQINPEAFRRPELSDVRLMSGVPSEKMPFEDASFDIVTAQFALEYTDIGLSLEETLRVLAPGGQIALVVHTNDSRISAVSQAQLDQIEWLQRPDGFFDAACQMIRVIESRRSAEKPVAEHEDVRAHYNKEATLLIRRIEKGEMGDALARAAIVVQRALASVATGPGAESDFRFEDALRAFEDEASRLQEQINAARSPDQLHGIATRLEEAGMSVQIGSMHQHGYLMGATVVAKK
jgi:SAM-dependent methyltransferase